MYEPVCLTFSADLLALDKKHLHSRVSQLLASQVCFGEHDREWNAFALIVSVNGSFYHQHFNWLCKGETLDASLCCSGSAPTVGSLEVFHCAIICKPLCISSRCWDGCCFPVEWRPQSNPEDQLSNVQPGPDSHLHPAVPGLHRVGFMMRIAPEMQHGKMFVTVLISGPRIPLKELCICVPVLQMLSGRKLEVGWTGISLILN